MLGYLQGHDGKLILVIQYAIRYVHLASGSWLGVLQYTGMLIHMARLTVCITPSSSCLSTAYYTVISGQEY